MTQVDPKLREEVAELHARMCSGLADCNRILILYSLSNGPVNVGDLADMLALPQPTVSRHLKVLRERGLVRAERNGQSVFYSVSDMRIIDAMDTLRAVMTDLIENQAALTRAD